MEKNNRVTKNCPKGQETPLFSGAAIVVFIRALRAIVRCPNDYTGSALVRPIGVGHRVEAKILRLIAVRYRTASSRSGPDPDLPLVADGGSRYIDKACRTSRRSYRLRVTRLVTTAERVDRLIDYVAASPRFANTGVRISTHIAAISG